MSQQREIVNPEELVQRGFVRDSVDVGNHVDMVRETRKHLFICVWKHTAAESFKLVLADNEDCERDVVQVGEFATLPEALPLIDALIAAFTRQDPGK